MPWKDRERRWDQVAVALLALAVAAPLAAQTDLAEASVQAGQQLRLEDVPTGGLGPSSVSGLPLDESQRATLQEDLKVRDYPRAEALLVKEAERHPKSRELLIAAGRIFFLDGKYLNCAVAMKKAEALSSLGEHDHFTLALSYIILNHRDWARPELEKLAALNPHEPLYPYWLRCLDSDAMQPCRLQRPQVCRRRRIELEGGRFGLGSEEWELGALHLLQGFAVTKRRIESMPPLYGALTFCRRSQLNSVSLMGASGRGFQTCSSPYFPKARAISRTWQPALPQQLPM